MPILISTTYKKHKNISDCYVFFNFLEKAAKFSCETPRNRTVI